MLWTIVTLVSTFLFFSIATYGWGQLAVAFLFDDDRPKMAYTISLGLLVWAFWGGILNVLHIAVPDILYVLVFFGIVYFLIKLKAHYSCEWKSLPSNILGKLKSYFTYRIRDLSGVVSIILLSAVVIYISIMLLPASAFNIQDDFQTYFVRIIRMLQTGTMGGNDISMLGIDSFGIQTFLQAFFILKLPISYVNFFDLVFCLLLSGLLINEIGQRVGAHWGYRCVAILLFVFMDPRIVNISANYSGALAIIGLIYASKIFLDSLYSSNREGTIKLAIQVGMFAAFAVALKVTLLPFVASYLIILLLACLIISQDRRHVLISASCAVLAAVLFVLPWIGMSLDTFQSIFSYVINIDGAAEIALVKSKQESVYSIYSVLFSNEPVGTGGTFFDATFTIASLVVTGVVTCFLSSGISGLRKNNHLLLIIVTCAAVLTSFLIMPLFLDVPAWLIRYFSPVLIATVPVVMMMISSQFSLAGKLCPNSISPAVTTMLLLIQIVVLYLHLDLFVNRYQRALTSHSLLTFQFLDKETSSTAYLSLNKNALSHLAREKVSYAQSLADEKTTILAWVSHPFYLDYIRNNILSVDAGGLGLSKLPLTSDTEKFRAYLLGLGVDYVLWRYQGPGIRGNKQLRAMIKHVATAEGRHIKPELDLRLILESLGKSSKLIMNNGRMVLFDIRK